MRRPLRTEAVAQTSQGVPVRRSMTGRSMVGARQAGQLCSLVTGPTSTGRGRWIVSGSAGPGGVVGRCHCREAERADPGDCQEPPALPVGVPLLRGQENGGVAPKVSKGLLRRRRLILPSAAGAT
jgi:hypothetical protein